jgi:UDP-glucuronate 4-epimerase
MHILLTGGAGFIGSHLTDRLLASHCAVTTVDNLDPFYDRAMKLRNIANAAQHPDFRFIEADITNMMELQRRLNGNYDAVVHLAAKAGVRPSIIDPFAYQTVNVLGTQNLLELSKLWGVKQFIFASSSSVYGVNPRVPWREDDHVLLPISPYASTKVAGELMGHVYSHLYGIRFLALRFFTVYGPRQRPDLAIHRFTDLIGRGLPISLYGDGTTRRDYTFIGDIVTGIEKAITYEDSEYEVINLGNSRTVTLNDLLGRLQDLLETEAQVIHLAEQPGDVPQTYADISKARTLLGFEPHTDLSAGLTQFISWFRDNASEEKAAA